MDQASNEPTITPTEKTLEFHQGAASSHFKPKFDDALVFHSGPVFGQIGLHVDVQLGGNSKRAAVMRIDAVKVRELRDYLNLLLGEVGAERAELDEQTLLADPSITFWLKDAIRGLDQRDPVDAIADAEILLKVCERRHERLLQANGVAR